MPKLTVIECGTCHQAAGTGLVCEHCGEIQPRPGVDKFAALGVSRSFALDREALDARYRELSRRLHPDRFATAPAQARVLSLQAATLLNEAYRTLREPIARAEYLIELLGMPIDARTTVPPAFLAEMLELREEVEAARTGGDERRLGELRDGLLARRDRALEVVGAGFEAWKGAGGQAELERVRAALVEIRYLNRALDGVEGSEEEGQG